MRHRTNGESGKAYALVLAAVVSGTLLGCGLTELRVRIESDIDDLMSTETMRTIEDIESAAPELIVEGPDGPFKDELRRALVESKVGREGRVHLSFSEDLQSGSRKRSVKVKAIAHWVSFPRLSKFRGTFNAEITAEGGSSGSLDADIGRSVGDEIGQWLLRSRPEGPRDRGEAPGKAVSVELNSNQTCVLFEDGDVHCFGPTASALASVSGLEDAVEQSGPGCARTRDGRVMCWDLSNPNLLLQAEPACGITKASAIGGSRSAGCAIVDGDRVTCWTSKAFGSCSKTGADAEGLYSVALPESLADVEPIELRILPWNDPDDHCIRFKNGAVACFELGSPEEAPTATIANWVKNADRLGSADGSVCARSDF